MAGAVDAGKPSNELRLPVMMICDLSPPALHFPELVLCNRLTVCNLTRRAHIVVRLQQLDLNVGEESSLWGRTALPSTDIALPVPDLRLTKESPSRLHARARIPLPMDIREWLQNTVDREPPEEQDNHGFPEFFQPHRDTHPEPQPAHRHHGRRKRASSESASDDRRHTGEKRRRLAARSPSPAHRQPARSASSTSQSSRSSCSEDSEEQLHQEKAPETFERRARHKTRPDRYEHKPKKHRKDCGSKVETKSKTKKQKVRRKADGERTSGLIQSFQLKNGPKNNRLTLRPNVSAGIFKHGRASGPITANGPGLPDLVFNEMKFLQRPKEHQDELPNNESSKQRAKKSRKQLQEEEVSTYFARKPPATQHTNAQTRDAPPAQAQSTHEIPSGRPTDPEPQTHPRETSKAPVDRPEKAFLGFGSRGPAPERTSNSYFTWSESAVAGPPEKPRRHQVSKPMITTKGKENESALQPERHEASQKSPKGHYDLEDDAASSTGRWVQTNRAKVPRLVQVYQPVDAKKHGGDLFQPSDLVLPSREPPQDPLNEDNRSAARTTHRRLSSYHTSDILKVRGMYHDKDRVPSFVTQRPKTGEAPDKENMSPTSTPTSHNLRQAFQFVNDPHTDCGEKLDKSATIDDFAQTIPGYRQHSFDICSRTPDTNRPIGPTARDAHKIGLPQRGLSRSTASLNYHERPQLQDIADTGGHDQRLRKPNVPTGWVGSRNTTPLKNFSNASRYTPRKDTSYIRGRQTEELVRQLASKQERNPTFAPARQNRELLGSVYPDTGSIDPGYTDTVSYYAYQPAAGPSEGLPTELPSVSIYSVDAGNGDDENIDAGTENVGAMPGFWKRNVLY